MKKTLYLTRHGETQWNTIRRMQGQKDSPLTEMGVKQAVWLAESLRDTKIDVIYASPLGRAYETAKLIRGDRDIEIIKRDELKELFFGSWEGETKEDLSKKFPHVEYCLWNEPENYEPVDGEDFGELKKRCETFVKEVLLTSEHKHIMVVTHAITLKGFLNYTQNKEIKDFWGGPHIQPTSLTKAKFSEEDIVYEFIADTSHYKEESSFNGWFSDK